MRQYTSFAELRRMVTATSATFRQAINPGGVKATRGTGKPLRLDHPRTQSCRFLWASAPHSRLFPGLGGAVVVVHAQKVQDPVRTHARTHAPRTVSAHRSSRKRVDERAPIRHRSRTGALTQKAATLQRAVPRLVFPPERLPSRRRQRRRRWPSRWSLLGQTGGFRVLHRPR